MLHQHKKEGKGKKFTDVRVHNRTQTETVALVALTSAAQSLPGKPKNDGVQPSSPADKSRPSLGTLVMEYSVPQIIANNQEIESQTTVIAHKNLVPIKKRKGKVISQRKMTRLAIRIKLLSIG